MSATKIWLHCLSRWIRFDFKHFPIKKRNPFRREWVLCSCGYGKETDPYRGTCMD